METARNEPTPSETEASTSTSTSAAPNVENGAKEEESFKTKTIKFLGRRTPIILQNYNGPCPLIAICNFLSLKNSLNLSPEVLEVKKKMLLDLVFEPLMARVIDCKDSSYVESQQQKVFEALEFSEKLSTGINLNIGFRRINDFDLTGECAIFDLLEIPCYHGWLVDPQNRETAEAIGSKFYNTVTKGIVPLDGQNIENELKNTKEDDAADIEEEAEHLRVLKLSEGSACSSAADEESTEDKISIRQAELIGNFLKDSASQLTVYGLFSLLEGVKEGELCVFFRNNHFNTMIKYKGQLYILLADEGYMNHPALVWETLTEENGDSQFVNENFQIDQSFDRAFARALQDEEDKKQERQATSESDSDSSEEDSRSDESDTSSTEKEEEEESKTKIYPFPWLFV